MRLHTVLLGCGLLLASATMAQSGAKQVTGKIEMKQLMSDSAFRWFYTGVNKYQVNEAMVNYIKTNKDKIQLVALVNTAEPSSQELIAKLYKITILSSVPEESVHLYGVDNSGNSGVAVADGYKVKKVPSILVMRDGKEEGRVSGAPKATLEQDIAQIIMKMNNATK